MTKAKDLLEERKGSVEKEKLPKPVSSSRKSPPKRNGTNQQLPKHAPSKRSPPSTKKSIKNKESISSSKESQKQKNLSAKTMVSASRVRTTQNMSEQLPVKTLATKTKNTIPCQVKATELFKPAITKDHIVVALECSILSDGSSSYLTQIGASVHLDQSSLVESGGRHVFFVAIVPGLLIKTSFKKLTKENQANVLQLLKLEVEKGEDNVMQETFDFVYGHNNKGEITAMSEKDGLNKLVDFLQLVKRSSGKQIVLASHHKDSVLPVILSKLRQYDILTRYTDIVAGCYNMVGVARHLKIGTMCGPVTREDQPDLGELFDRVEEEWEWGKEVREADEAALLMNVVMERIWEQGKEDWEEGCKVQDMGVYLAAREQIERSVREDEDPEVITSVAMGKSWRKEDEEGLFFSDS